MELWSLTIVPFLIPLGVVVLFTSIQVGLLLFGGISLGLDMDADVDADIDLDVHHDFDLDLDHGVELDAPAADVIHVDLDLDVDHDGDVDHHADHFSLAKILTPLGVGQVPLTVVWQALFLSWGVSGTSLSYALGSFLGGQHLWFLALTLPTSLVLSWFATKYMVRMVAPLLKISGQAESERQLLGRSGEVTSLRVDGKFGEAVLNINGAPNHVVVITRGDPIERGNEVVVVDYDVVARRPVVALVKPHVATSEGS